MLHTFLKIAGRNMWRTKRYALINVTGLAIGTCCVLCAALYVIDEHRFDDFHRANPNLYRITSTYRDRGETITTGGTGQVQGPAFQARLPGITHFTRVMGGDIYGDVRHKTQVFKLQLLFVDSSFFDVFTFPLLAGQPKTALRDVNSVVITRKTAMKFFNRIDVVGEIMAMDADPSAIRLGKPLVVAAVAEDPPAHSSIRFDMLLPFGFMQVSFDDNSWLNAYLGTFVVLRPDTDLHALTTQFNRIAASLSENQRRESPEASTVTYGLQPMIDIHLDPKQVPEQSVESGIVNGSKPVYWRIFMCVAAFILLMASVNFINITIASTARRSKEVGIRKVTGSGRRGIIGQLLGESAMLIAFAMLLALGVIWTVLPYFNRFTGKNIHFADMPESGLLPWLAGISLVNMLSAALHPAWRLSKLTPLAALYRKPLAARNATGHFLMVFQFATAILLGIACLVCNRQMHFIHTRSLGYNPDEVVQVQLSGVRDVKRIYARFREELAGEASVRAISLTGDFGYREVTAGGKKLRTHVRTIDAHYLPMLEMKLLAGRNLSEQSPADGRFGVIVNEAFVKRAGIKDPIGKTLLADSNFGNAELTIMGVVRDFHYQSFKERIGPMMMPSSTFFGGGAVSVKISKRNRQATLRKLEKAFSKVLPGASFDYAFMRDGNAYAMEAKSQRLITILTTVAVLICAMGLFGLTHLAITQRRRETGIRIVLGATGREIALLFSGAFIRIILVAIIIAVPAAYYLMHRWLGHFAYHAGIPWWALILPGVAALAIALVTVSLQVARAVITDPVRALRSE